MMTIANRLRGTYGWFARVFGLAATIAVYLFSGSWVIAVLTGASRVLVWVVTRHCVDWIDMLFVCVIVFVLVVSNS
jgi:hypothetical protein